MLCQAVVRNKNFKVRINAAVALAVPTNEQFLQTHFAFIWSSLLEALDGSGEMTDFNEYQHRDHLTEQVIMSNFLFIGNFVNAVLPQLCITISHYIQHATIDQLVMMEKDVLRYDSTKTNWSRVINRMIPEKATSLIEITVRLQNLLSDVSKHDQKKALATLTSTFESMLN